MCFDRHWPTFSGGLILVALASRNHFGKKEKEKEKKRSLAPSFTYFFPFCFFLFQAFNSYPAWKNLPDSTAKRYLKEIRRHVYPLTYFQTPRGYWSFRHLIRMLFS